MCPMGLGSAEGPSPCQEAPVLACPPSPVPAPPSRVPWFCFPQVLRSRGYRTQPQGGQLPFGDTHIKPHVHPGLRGTSATWGSC